MSLMVKGPRRIQIAQEVIRTIRKILRDRYRNMSLAGDGRAGEKRKVDWAARVEVVVMKFFDDVKNKNPEMYRKCYRIAMYRVCDLPLSQCDTDYGWVRDTANRTNSAQKEFIDRLCSYLRTQIVRGFQQELVTLMSELILYSRESVKIIDAAQRDVPYNGKPVTKDQTINARMMLTLARDALTRLGDFASLPDENPDVLDEREAAFEATAVDMGVDDLLGVDVTDQAVS